MGVGEYLNLHTTKDLSLEALNCLGAGQVTCTEYIVGYNDSCVEYGGGGISSKLGSCCNSKSACEQIKESSLPMTCLSPQTAKVGGNSGVAAYCC